MRAVVTADPTIVNRGGVHGMSLLMHAALSGDTDLAVFLNESGATLGLDSARHAAMQQGHQDMTRWDLDHGVTDLQILNFDDKPPCKWPTHNNYTQSRICGALVGRTSNDSVGHLPKDRSDPNGTHNDSFLPR